MATANQPWMNRLHRTLAGLFCLVISVPLLMWNEGRAVQAARAQNEGAASVMSISAAEVDPAHEGKLVHLSGDLIVDDTLTDPTFGISQNAIKLQRIVEMYQWEQHSGQDAATSQKTFAYSKRWSQRVIDSKSFADPMMQNPTQKPYDDWQGTARNVRLGQYRLSASLIEQANNLQPLRIDEALWKEFPAAVQEKVKREEAGLYLGADPAHPAIGDARIRFLVSKPALVSILARQSGPSFEPYYTPVSGAAPVESLTYGRQTAARLYQRDVTVSSTGTWILRTVGLVVLWLGIGFLSRGLISLTAYIPYISELSYLNAVVYSTFLAFAVTALILSANWLSYRPIVAIGLFLLAATLLFLAYRLGRRRSARLRR